MKSLFLLVAFSLSATMLFAQGTNLEFSETKYIKFSQTLSIDGVVATQQLVVPEGQTWKLESAVVSYKYSSGGVVSYAFTPNLDLLLDEVIIFTYDNLDHYTFPMWLPAGTYTLTLWSDTSWSSAYTGLATVTAVVFNIVQ